MTRLIVVVVMFGGSACVQAAPGGKSLSVEAFAIGSKFADQLQSVTTLLVREYVKPIPAKKYYTTALLALYDAARQTPPKQLLADLEASTDEDDLRQLIVRARAALADAPELTTPRDLVVAMRAYTSILDPASVLLPSAALNGTVTLNRYGFELEGEALPAVGKRAAKRPVAEDAPIEDLASDHPPHVPFRITQVKPGSPAQKAGLRPGDQITQIDTIRADIHSAGQAFAALHKDQDSPKKHTLMVERWGEKQALRLTLEPADFVQESLFGVKRKANNEWDYWIDRDAGLAYVRLGAIEHDSGDLLSEILHHLRDIKGLLLDLRWCPGGYIDSATQIASIFLEDGVIARMTYRNPGRGGAKEIRADGGLVRYKAGSYPILVLVNGDTVGGGELIAAALKDNDRAVLAGTRTHGKATIQWPEAMRELPGYSFKITGGTYTRPNGKNLQRYPTSKPTDDWGLRPDDGYAIPASVDLTKKLKEMHTLYALRPGGSREALDLDDPDTDPQRVRAVKLLRELVKKAVK